MEYSYCILGLYLEFCTTQTGNCLIRVYFRLAIAISKASMQPWAERLLSPPYWSAMVSEAEGGGSHLGFNYIFYLVRTIKAVRNTSAMFLTTRNNYGYCTGIVYRA